ncbi:MAG: hypothetical protein JNK05_36570 [Myxococcales bacterium]|nr:hypothetical protein [Myxococcales bacterium]
MKKSLAVLFVLAASALNACSYGGIAVAPNGTVYVARNDSFLFGALRHIYACQANGPALNCADANGP